eukprot:TRINITY_DN2156_c0_g2_i2.p1 TRINITY_DN2156_c0_g2~~TRINITY_DN2156_c0_g2_i2.p1  ORF type:complete len:403 (-),score=69.90 TRINITY_DN2156_c0_g2_i2:37-1245(-)
MEKLILSKMTPTGAQAKRIILVINKIDLVPPEVLTKWIKHLRREYPTIAFKSSTQTKGKLGSTKAKATKHSDLSFSGSIGGEALLQLIKNYSRSQNIKTAITVGVLGYPNVGKSSVINSLKRQRAVEVGATPGVTKTLQHVKLDSNVHLIDSPGVLFAKSEKDEGLFLRNCLKVEQIEDPVGVVDLIVKRCPMTQLCQVYSIPAYKDADDFILAVAQRRGQLKKGGIPHVRAAALAIIQDWNRGLVPFYSLPPETKDIQSSEVVATWTTEFDSEGTLIKFDEKAITEFKEKVPPASSFTVLAPQSAKKVDTDRKMETDSKMDPKSTPLLDDAPVSKAKTIKKKKKVAKKKERRERRKSVVGETEMTTDQDEGAEEEKTSKQSKASATSGKQADDYDFETDWS